MQDGEPDLSKIGTASDIMTDTRDAVSDISSDGHVYEESVQAGMGDRLKDVGVGGVKAKYLKNAYEPFLPMTLQAIRSSWRIHHNEFKIILLQNKLHIMPVVQIG